MNSQLYQRCIWTIDRSEREELAFCARGYIKSTFVCQSQRQSTFLPCAKKSQTPVRLVEIEPQGGLAFRCRCGSLFLCFNHQPTHQGPLEGTQPGNYQCCQEIVQQPPRNKKTLSVDNNQCKGNPKPETIATGYQFGEKGASLFHPLPQGLKELRFWNGKRDSGINKRQ